MKRKSPSTKIIVDWDTSRSKKNFMKQELDEISNLNNYPRGSSQRREKTIELAKKLKRSYKAIYNRSTGNNLSKPDRNSYGVDWELQSSNKPYTTEEIIMLSKVAVHSKASEGSVTRLAIQYGRTPWALTVRISKMRKTGEWKQWLDYEKKISKRT